MAIIYTYPVKLTAVNDDLIIITDSEDENLTKQIKVSSLPGGTSSGVNRILAGNNIELTPSDGIGNVTINVTGGNTGTVTGTGTFNTLPKWDSTGAAIEDSMTSQSSDAVIFSIKSGDETDSSLKSPILRLENTSLGTWEQEDTVGSMEFLVYDDPDNSRVNAYIKNRNDLITDSGPNGGLTFGGSFYNGIPDPTSTTLHEIGSLIPETNQEGFLSGSIFTVKNGPYQASTTASILSITIPKIRTEMSYGGTWDPYQKISEVQFFSKEPNKSAIKQAYINIDNGANEAGVGAGEISFGVSQSNQEITVEAVRIKGDTTTVFERNMPLSISVTGTLDPTKTLLVPQEKELTGNASGAGLKGLLVASAVNTGNLIVTEIGNGRYVDGENLDVNGNYLYTDGTPVTELSWSVNASASKGDVILQGDLYDSKLETGTSGQVLKSLGVNGGIFWDTLPTTTGTVTKVDAGTGMVSNPSTGIINTGDVAINYTGANNAILSATAGNIESTDTIWFSAADSGNIEKGLVSDLISKVTGYTAGTGLLLNGNVFSIDIPLSVANGGTNLTDISTLENVNIDFASDGTGVLPISHGGSNNSSIAINSIFHSGPTSNLGTGEYTVIETTDANSNYVLTSNGAGNAPSWKLAPSSNVSIGTSGVSTGLDDAIISETSLTGSVLITSNAYNGGNSVGHVPSGGTNATVYLDGTGNWSVPSGSGGGGGGTSVVANPGGTPATTLSTITIGTTDYVIGSGIVAVTGPSGKTFGSSTGEIVFNGSVVQSGTDLNTFTFNSGTPTFIGRCWLPHSYDTAPSGSGTTPYLRQVIIEGPATGDYYDDVNFGILNQAITPTPAVDGRVRSSPFDLIADPNDPEYGLYTIVSTQNNSYNANPQSDKEGSVLRFAAAAVGTFWITVDINGIVDKSSVAEGSVTPVWISITTSSGKILAATTTTIAINPSSTNGTPDTDPNNVPLPIYNSYHRGFYYTKTDDTVSEDIGVRIAGNRVFGGGEGGNTPITCIALEPPYVAPQSNTAIPSAPFNVGFPMAAGAPNPTPPVINEINLWKIK